MNKLAVLSKDMGRINALLYVFHRLISRFTLGKGGIERFIFVAQPVPDKAFISPKKASSSVVKQLKAGDPLLSQCQRPPHVIADRFAQGAICLAIIKEQQLQGSIWLIQQQYDEDVVRARFMLPRSGIAVWDFDVYVVPEYRLGFTFLKLWDAANAYIRELGAQWTYSRITAFNLGSLASHNRLGARRFGSATFFVFGPIQIMVSSLAPKLHVSLGKSRPRLKMPENIA